MKPTTIFSVNVPDLNNKNSTLKVSLRLINDKFDFTQNFKNSKSYPKKDSTNKQGYTRDTLLEAAKKIYLERRAEQEQLIAAQEEAVIPHNAPQKALEQDSILRRQSMFAESGGLVGACVVPAIALGVMTAFIVPLTALFPSFIALAGVATAVLLMAAIVGKIIGALAGMATEYMSRPENMITATV